jgi:hypothetical protein
MATPIVSLTIIPASNAQRLVTIIGKQFFSTGHSTRVRARLLGDDPFFDDELFNMGEGVISDGQFIFQVHVPNVVLNEDWGQDEVYAIATVDGIGDFRSNTVKGHF